MPRAPRGSFLAAASTKLCGAVAVPALQPAVCVHMASVVRAFKPAVCQRSNPASLPAASTKPCGGQPLLFQRCSQPSNRQNFQNPWEASTRHSGRRHLLGDCCRPRFASIASVVPAYIPSVCQLSHLSNASRQRFCHCHLFLRQAQLLSISLPFFLCLFVGNVPMFHLASFSRRRDMRHRNAPT